MTQGLRVHQYNIASLQENDLMLDAYKKRLHRKKERNAVSGCSQLLIVKITNRTWPDVNYQAEHHKKKHKHFYLQKEFNALL